MYEHIWNGKELVQRFTGQVTGDQITESVNAILGDYRFDEIRSLIGDYSQCDGFSIQPQLLEEISATLGAAAITNPQITIAIVTERPEIVAAAWAYLASGLAVYPLRIFPAIFAKFRRYGT